MGPRDFLFIGSWIHLQWYTTGVPNEHKWNNDPRWKMQDICTARSQQRWMDVTILSGVIRNMMDGRSAVASLRSAYLILPCTISFVLHEEFLRQT